MEESPEDPQIPEQLVRAGASGRLCVVLGPHLVVGSGFPTPEETWRTLFTRALQECAAAHREELEEARDIFTEPGNHRDKYALLSAIMGEAFVDGSIIGALRGIQSTPTPLHRALAELPALFLTTLPDELLQRARTEKNFPCFTSLLDDGDDIRLPMSGDILALGGTAIKSGIMPFARPALSLTNERQIRLQKILNRFSAVLFLGFEAHDDELLAVLHLLTDAQLDPLPRHYWLASRDARIRARAAAYKIEPLWLDRGQTAEGFCRALTHRIANQNAERTSLWPLPKNTPEEIRQALAAGHRALAVGNLAMAAERGFLVFEQREANTEPQLVLEGLALLYFALRGTLFEEPSDAVLIAVEERGRVLEVLEKGLEGLRDVPDPWGKQAGSLAVCVDGLIMYASTTNRTIVDTNALQEPSPFDSADAPILQQITDLAQAGNVEEALMRAASLKHPWKGALVRAIMLAANNQSERALIIMLDICRQYPNRPELDGFAAYLLLANGRHDEAAQYAERAFQQFPIRFFRYLRGDILSRQNKVHEAWEVLLPLADSNAPEVVKLRALLAAQVAPESAPALFSRYLEMVPDDYQARYAFAVCEQSAGRREHAAELAWGLFESAAKSSLRAEILYFIGLSQVPTEQAPSSDVRERVLAIADELTKRFIGDERAARMRKTLLARLEEPVATDAPSLAAVHNLMLEGLPTTRALSESYERMGVPSFARLSDELKIAPASLLRILSEPAEHRQLPALSLAMDPMMTPADLQGKRILVGPLELSLVEKLKLWSSLPDALGPDGRLVVFDSVADAISRAGNDAPEKSEDRELADALAREMQSGLVETRAKPLTYAPKDESMDRGALTTNYSLSLHVELTYYEMLVGNPELSLLCADALMASPYGALGKAAANFALAKMSFQDRLDALRDRLIFFSAFVHAVYSRYDQVQLPVMLPLAELGFTDAFGAPQILLLARGHGGIDKEEPARILNRAERLARTPQHFAQYDAVTTLALNYAQAIWEATCGDASWEENAAKALTIGLLNRAEEVERTARTGLLERVIENIGKWALTFPMASGVAAVGTPPQLSEHSRAARLWQNINEWVGAVGHRRAALNRGLSRLWLLVDEGTKGVGPTKELAAPLMLGTFKTVNLRAQDSLGTFGAVSILSAMWTEKTLDDCKVVAWKRNSDEHPTVPVYELLSSMVAQIERNFYFLTDSVCSVDVDMQVGGSLQFEARPEAALLRVQRRHIIDFTNELAAKQGLHDGRAYDRLIEFTQRPTDKELRRTIARQAVQLPFLLFREDPSTVLQWTHVQMPGWPRTLDEFCAMSSEPVESPPDDKTLGEWLDARILEGGSWWRRLDRGNLFGQATQVPGAISIHVFSLNWPENPVEYGRIVASYLNVLEKPNEHSAGRIAQAIFGLRIIAEYNEHVSLPQGDVDLRERLPERLIGLLDVIETPPPQGTLAAYEAGLLRLCSVQVKRLDDESRLSQRHQLWLTYRLFQWIVAQLDTLTPTAKLAAFEVLATGLPLPDVEKASDDLLDPAGFETKDGIDYRLITILYALSQMNIVAKASNDGEGQEESKVKPWRFSSTMLEKRYAKLAERPLTNREKRVRPRGMTPTSFDWEAPGTIPDLALLALVTSRREGFARIAPDARLRWIQDLPVGPNDTTRMPLVVAGALHPAIVAALPDLGVEEAKAFEEKLRALENDAVTSSWRWLGLTALYRAGQGKVTEEEVLELLLGHLGAKSAPKVFGWALLGVARKNPDGLEKIVTRVLDTAMERKLDPVPLAEGVTFVLALGKNRASITKAKEILLALNARPPFQGHERMKKLVAQFGLS